MSNVALHWDAANNRADWSVQGGRVATGRLLASAVLLSLFTDRVAQPDYVAPDGSGDRRGWWHDTFEGVPIGSRLWQLRRRKIADRNALIGEAGDMVREALQWLLDSGLASAVDVAVTSAPAGGGSSGNLLAFTVRIAQPAAPSLSLRLLWDATHAR